MNTIENDTASEQKTAIDGLSYDFNGEFVHIKHPPGFEITAKTMGGFWSWLHKTCSDNKCSRVLVEAPAPVRNMNTMAAFDSGTGAAASTRKLRVALCFENYEPDDLSEFFKTVARNRGVKIEFFSDFDSAREWLLD